MASTYNHIKNSREKYSLNMLEYGMYMAISDSIIQKECGTALEHLPREISEDHVNSLIEKTDLFIEKGLITSNHLNKELLQIETNRTNWRESKNKQREKNKMSTQDSTEDSVQESQGRRQSKEESISISKEEVLVVNDITLDNFSTKLEADDVITEMRDSLDGFGCSIFEYIRFRSKDEWKDELELIRKKVKEMVKDQEKKKKDIGPQQYRDNEQILRDSTTHEEIKEN